MAVALRRVALAHPGVHSAAHQCLNCIIDYAMDLRATHRAAIIRNGAAELAEPTGRAIVSMASGGQGSEGKDRLTVLKA